MRRSSLLLLTVLAVMWGSDARGDLLTTFQDSLQPTTPAPGWSYLWNSTGPIGNPSNYSPLLATTHPIYYYDNDGVNGLPGSAPGAYVYFGSFYKGQAGGSPGLGSGDGGSGGIERFAIAAYTLNVGGVISITDSLLTNTDTSTDGLDLLVYVNSNPAAFFNGVTSAGLGSSLPFDVSLGTLNAGDTIYVAIGSRVTDAADSFSLSYGISSRAVPEPGSCALLGLGAVCIFAFQRRRASRRVRDTDAIGR